MSEFKPMSWFRGGRKTKEKTKMSHPSGKVKITAALNLEHVGRLHRILNEFPFSFTDERNVCVYV